MALVSTSGVLAAAAGRKGRGWEQLRGRWPWALCWSSLALVVLGVVLHLHNRSVPGNDQYFDPVLPALAVALAPVGCLIVSRRSRSNVGWLSCSAALAAVGFFGEQYGVFGLVTAPGALPGAGWAAWVGTWAWVPAYLAAWVLLPVLLALGESLSPRQCRFVWALAALIGAGTLGAALAPAGLESPLATNPVGLAAMPGVDGPIRELCVLVLAPMGLVYVHWRARQSSPQERHQLRWCRWACTALVAVPPVAVATALAGVPVPVVAYQASGVAAVLAVAGAMAVAILRHHLHGLAWEPATLVSTGAFYAALGCAALMVYLAAALVLGALVAGPGGLVPSSVALAVALVVSYQLQPPIRRAADRLLYRKRSYDYGILVALGRCLQSSTSPDDLLPAMVETIASALRLPGVAVTVGRRGQPGGAASWGEPGSTPLALALVHQGEQVGCLMVSPRAPGQSFDAADRRLLDDVSSQAAVVAYALCLSGDLQRSRERLVTAREEERRRLRRDLHDGIKPALAGVGLGIEAAANLVEESEPAAGQLLRRLRWELLSAGTDLHRLVHDLRPPALDELGLVAALRQQASTCSRSPSGPLVLVEGPAELGSLPAAVEVAAYRIGQEAMENSRRHSGAGLCHVVVSRTEEQLLVQVSDDGVGLAAPPSEGIGLPAMRERAAEVGGSCSIGPAVAGGTCVRARLPLGRQ